MIFLFPLLLILFVLLLCMKLLHAHIGWFWVGVPGVLFLVLLIIFTLYAWVSYLGKRKKKHKHE